MSIERDPLWPEHWGAARLGDICTRITSGSRDWKPYYERGDGVFILTQNVRMGRLDVSKPFHVDPPSDDPARARSQVEEGDLLLTIVGANVGNVARVPGPLPEHWVCQSLALIRLHDPRLSRFVELYLMAPAGGQAYFEGCFYGQGRPHLSFADIKAMPVPVPPPEEAEAIALQAHDQLARIAEGQQLIERAERSLTPYRQSVLTAAVVGQLVGNEHDDAPAADLRRDALASRPARWAANGMGRHKAPAGPSTSGPLPSGWEWTTVDELAVGVQYGTSSKTSADAVEGIPVLRMGNIVEGRLDFGDLKFLPHDHIEFPELLLAEGDLLFNRTNSPELVGKTAVARDLGGPVSFASYLIRVRLSEEVIPEYVSHYINSAYGRQWVRANVSQQVGQANVNGAKLRALTVPLPPRSVQARIVMRVSELESAGRAMQRALRTTVADSATLRASLLNAGINGELDSVARVRVSPEAETPSLVLVGE